MNQIVHINKVFKTKLLYCFVIVLFMIWWEVCETAVYSFMFLCCTNNFHLLSLLPSGSFLPHNNNMFALCFVSGGGGERQNAIFSFSLIYGTDKILLKAKLELTVGAHPSSPLLPNPFPSAPSSPISSIPDMEYHGLDLWL